MPKSFGWCFALPLPYVRRWLWRRGCAPSLFLFFLVQKRGLRNLHWHKFAIFVSELHVEFLPIIEQSPYRRISVEHFIRRRCSSILFAAPDRSTQFEIVRRCHSWNILVRTPTIPTPIDVGHLLIFARCCWDTIEYGV